MSEEIQAIVLCRVSSLEQLLNNSLGHQKVNVLKEAERLGATVPKDGVWEGQVSSKVGVNFKREDLVEMFEYCKKHPKVKYVIVQEVDRFMRSPDEQTYWYVRFKYDLSVFVWFADKPELNEETHMASLLRYMEGWRAAGSNEERKNKSINGQTAGLRDGRYPFAPKPGYMKGSRVGMPEVHPVRGPALKNVLVRLASRQVTPTEALIELNASSFMNGHSLYKMDKFRKIVCDPFYAGIVEINKQVKVRNENGLHEPLITKAQHYKLLEIMDSKAKNQSGPRRNGNPRFPCNNIVACSLCINGKNGRVVGFPHSNGKRGYEKVWEKYRCRSCGRYLTRDELHDEIELQFRKNPITAAGISELSKALEIVWKQQQGQTESEINRLIHKASSLEDAIMQQVEAATDPANEFIKQEITQAIARKKQEVQSIGAEIDKLRAETDSDKERFLQFAFKFVESMGRRFLEISPENRLRCKQIVFPAGFYIDENKKVYTPKISPLITLAATKKDAEASNNSQLVRVRGL